MLASASGALPSYSFDKSLKERDRFWSHRWTPHTVAGATDLPKAAAWSCSPLIGQTAARTEVCAACHREEETHRCNIYHARRDAMHRHDAEDAGFCFRCVFSEMISGIRRCAEHTTPSLLKTDCKGLYGVLTSMAVPRFGTAPPHQHHCTQRGQLCRWWRPSAADAQSLPCGRRPHQLRAIPRRGHVELAATRTGGSSNSMDFVVCASSCGLGYRFSRGRVGRARPRPAQISSLSALSFSKTKAGAHRRVIDLYSNHVWQAD